MATKLDLDKPLFLGPNPVRANTTMDHIRRAVSALDEGSGVPYPKLEEYLLQNYSPAKSKNYSGSFVKSYVRDMVKDTNGQLSYENGGHEYSAEEVAPPKRAAKAAKPKRVTKARQEELSVLVFIRDAGEVKDAGDVDNTQITPQDIASETNKKLKTVQTKIQALEKEGLLRTEDEGTGDDTKTLVYLTAAGLAAANGQDPEGASSSEGAEEGEPAVEAA